MISKLFALAYSTKRISARSRRSRHLARGTGRLGLHHESLEDRRLLAAGIFFDAERSQINIVGSRADDVAEVTRVEEEIRVMLAAGDNKFEQAFRQAAVDSILFWGHSGHDRFVNATNVPSIARGGAGNDRLIGGTSDDQLFGDGGDDVIDGREGDDHLRGGRQSDRLRGNAGNDVLLGDSGSDQLDGAHQL